MHQTKDLLIGFHFKDKDAEKFTWSTGKVISISKDERERIVEALQSENVYSIGRFGLWNRKLLVDSTINQAKMVVEHIMGVDWDKTKQVLL